MQLASIEPMHHRPAPILPELGTLRYTYLNGTSRELRIRQYLHEPTDFNTRYTSIRDAKKAINEYNGELLGVAFGVLQASEGAYLIRPLESHNGYAFVIDGPEHGARIAHGSALPGSPLVGIVGLDSWIDLTDPERRTNQPVVKFPG